MAFVCRIFLFLIPVTVTAAILHDHAFYFPADHCQSTDCADW